MFLEERRALEKRGRWDAIWEREYRRRLFREQGVVVVHYPLYERERQRESTGLNL
jgi:hypothetical protein